jgi:ketosteroid isomerase-like protein
VGVRRLPAIAVAVGFVDCVNRGDLDGLASLLAEDHRLEVFDEAPLVGRDANVAAWRGYFEAFPEYVIYPARLAEVDGGAAILGSTTGSHLGRPDDEERQEMLLWVVEVRDGLVSRWRLVEDTPDNRRRFNLD